jgi:hypothetical protein
MATGAVRGKVTPEYQAAVIDAPPSYFALSYDIGRGCTDKRKGGQKAFEGFGTIDAMLTWYARTWRRCCYEILRESLPICVCFDLELDFSEANHLPVAELHGYRRDAPEAFLNHILERVMVAFPQLKEGPPPLLSSSHAAGRKHSWHVKYPGHCLPTQQNRDMFKMAVGRQLGDLVPCVDTSVYSRRKNMRLLYSHKHGDASRPLVPVGEGSSAAFCIEAVRAHMWTSVPTSAVPLTLDAADLRVRFAPPAARTSAKRPRPESGSPTSEAHGGTDFSVRFGCTFEAYAARASHLLGDAGGDPANHDAGDASCLYWHTVRAHTCVHGNVHIEDNFLTRLTGAVIMRACMASECRSDVDGAHLVWCPLGYLADEAPVSEPRERLGAPPGAFEVYAPGLAACFEARVWCIRAYPLSDVHLRARTYLTVDSNGVWRRICIDHATCARFHTCTPGESAPPTRQWSIVLFSAARLRPSFDAWFQAQWGVHFAHLGATRSPRGAYTVRALGADNATRDPWLHLPELARQVV